MAWNQPGNKSGGNSGKPPERRNPWDGGSSGNTPPGLEDVLRRLNDFFGNGLRPGRLLLLGLVALGLVYASLGFHQVHSGERVLVLRNGRLHDIQTPGLHWNPPLLDTFLRVNVAELRQATLTTDVITADEELATVSLSLRYRVIDPEAYVLQLADAESVLLRAVESVLQEQAATLTLADLTGSGQVQLAAALQREAGRRFQAYGSGLELSGLSLTSLLPPTELGAAYDDVQHAREERVLRTAEARKEAQQALQQVRTATGKDLAEAEQDKGRALAEARAAAQRFSEHLAAYRSDPRATRQRLFDEAVAEVLARTRTVIIGEEGLETLGVPLEKLQQPSPLPPAPAGGTLPRGRP